jgi:glyoxylase-like metal-dependent hydrolase (beta-lactamase superfamily II)
MAATDLSAMELRQVAPGVYAALQPAERRFDDCNSAVIVTDDGVVVVDTQVDPQGARAVLDAIRATTDLPVRIVINTHWHSDHVQGNQVYRKAFPEAEILAHRNTREDIVLRGIPEHAEELETLPERLRGAEGQLVDGLRRDGTPLTQDDRELLKDAIARGWTRLERLEQIEFALPDVTFEGSVTLHLGATELRLLHFPGHTRGDVVVYLPQQKVLVTGDLLDDLPFTGHGSPAGLVDTLGRLEELDFEHVIPGHGSVRHGRDHLRLVARLFGSLVAQVEEAVRDGLDPEQTGGRVKLEEFEAALVTDPVSERYWGFFIPEAIARAHAEAQETR